jgi:hypothetical protein
MRRPLDVPALVDDCGVVGVRVGQAFGVGRNPPIPDQEIAFVSSGRVAAVVTTHEGAAELPPRLRADSVGVFRVRDAGAADAVDAIERRVRVAGHALVEDDPPQLDAAGREHMKVRDVRDPKHRAQVLRFPVERARRPSRTPSRGPESQMGRRCCRSDGEPPVRET